MKNRFLRLMMLSSFIWVLRANLHLLDSAAAAISRTNNEVEIKIEMQKIATYVRLDYVSDNVLPTDLVAVIKTTLEADAQRVTADTGKDKWGTYYRLVACTNGFYIVSAGPDRKWRTQDDIKFFQTLADLGYKGPSGKQMSGQASPRQPVRPKPAPAGAGRRSH